MCAACALFTLLLAPLVGSTPLDLGKALAGESPHHEVLFTLRLPRVLLAMLAGAALALAGALFQAVLRNPLATPDTLGVAAGASLGAVATIALGASTAFGLPALWLGAFLGAGVSLALVVAIAAEGGRVSSIALLLAGVTVNTMGTALILFLHATSGLVQSFAIARWLMGSLDAIEFGVLGWLALLVLPVAVVAMRPARSWNLLAVGEEWAATRGVATGRLLLLGYVAGSVLTGAVTAVTGPIGFVGLIVPHALRLRFGADHRLLLPCSCLAGAAFLATCDAVARTVLAPAEVPVGVVTSLLGGPFFVWLLRHRRQVPL